MLRNRKFYLIAVLVIIGLGITTRRIMEFPYFMYEYVGDVLWAMNLYMLFRLIFPAEKITLIAFISFAFAVLIEFSQLYHEAWIDSIRNTVIGGMILGYGFLWSDILCYAIGITLGVIADKIYLRFKTRVQT